MAGIFDKQAIQRIAPNAKLELFTGQSAYGPRVKCQLPKVVDELCTDNSSRRAILLIAHDDDNLDKRPCTTSMQFLIQNSGARVLHTIVNMRSSDAIWGLPYDIIQFGMMAEMMAIVVGVLVGSVVVHLANAHVYEDTQIPINMFKTYTSAYKIPHLPLISAYREWAENIIESSTDMFQLEHTLHVDRKKEEDFELRGI